MIKLIIFASCVTSMFYGATWAFKTIINTTQDIKERDIELAKKQAEVELIEAKTLNEAFRPIPKSQYENQ